VSRFNSHKKVLLSLLTEYCPSVFYQLCPADAGFPRTEFELRQLGVPDVPYEKYLLSLSLYDKGQSETLDSTIDALIAGVDKSVRYTSGFYYQFYYQNDRQSVPETDKTIKRIMLTFEVRVYVRSET
jgi:hypothetical protein